MFPSNPKCSLMGAHSARWFYRLCTFNVLLLTFWWLLKQTLLSNLLPSCLRFQRGNIRNLKTRLDSSVGNRSFPWKLQTFVKSNSLFTLSLNQTVNFKIFLDQGWTNGGYFGSVKGTLPKNICIIKSGHIGHINSLNRSGLKKNHLEIWQKLQIQLFFGPWNYVCAPCAEQSLHGSLPCAERSLHCSLLCAEQRLQICSAPGREQCRLCSAHGAET